MEDEHYLEIPVSKTKIFLLLVIGLLFVVIGGWSILNPSAFSRRSFPVVNVIMGVVCVLFFGLGVVMAIVKLFDKKPGLIFDKDGLINTISIQPERIYWSDIKEIGEYNVRSQKFVILRLKNSKKYIKSQKSSFKRQLANMSLNMSGAPYSLNSRVLKISHKELYVLLQERLELSRQQFSESRE